MSLDSEQYPKAIDSRSWQIRFWISVLSLLVYPLLSAVVAQMSLTVIFTRGEGLCSILNNIKFIISTLEHCQSLFTRTITADVRKLTSLRM